MTKQEANQRYHAKRGPILQFEERELQPSAVIALIESLESMELYPTDKRLDRLRKLLEDLT